MKSKLFFFNLLLLGVFIPFIGGGSFAKLGYFFLLASLLLAFPIFGKFAKKAILNSTTIYLFIFLLFYLLTSSFDVLGCVAIFGRLCAPIFFALLASVLYKYPYLYKVQRNFLIIWILVLCFFEFQSLNFIAQNPMGLRELISTEKDDNIIIGGGYNLPYSLAILIPGLFLFCKQKSLSNTFRVSGLGLCAFFALLVFSALYMIAILLMIAGIGLALIYGYPRSKQALIMIMILAVAVISYESIPVIIKEFSPEDTNVLMRRFDEIDSIISGNDVSKSEDLFSRLMLSLKSIETFLNNPVLGIGWESSYDFFELEKAGVGAHAEWFDIFACYGIFAVLLVIYLYKSATSAVKRKNITLTLFVILGFLNPCLQFTIVFVAYCLVPMCRLLLFNKNAFKHSDLDLVNGNEQSC